LSKDGEEGYPGTVEVRVWYVQEKEQGQEVLHIEYEAELVGDDVAETAVNITNHRYETTIVDLKALLILATATSTSPVLLLLLAPRSL